MERSRIARGMASVFAMGIVISGIHLGTVLHRYGTDRQVYQAIREEYQKAEAYEQHRGRTGVEEQFWHLKEKNADYAGWIEIPGTGISYPVVCEQEPEYYLTHDFTGRETEAGCIYIPSPIPGFAADNAVLLGHNRKDSSMFGSLKKYRDPDHMSRYSSIEIRIRGEIRRYQIFAVCEKEQGEGEPYMFFDDGEKQAYIDTCFKDSIHKEIGELPKAPENLLTLSTCAAPGKRLVIYASLLHNTKEASVPNAE